MDDPRDPRDLPDPSEPRDPADFAPEDSAPEASAPEGSASEPAEEFESQPLLTPFEPDGAEEEGGAADEVGRVVEADASPEADETATAEWPAADVGSGPPPSEVEANASQPAADEPQLATAHTVPATGIGETTQCPRCGTENRPGLAFCRNCGQRLMAAGAAATIERPGTPEGTEACPRCGTHNRAGTAFCQNCGANLRAVETAAGYVPPAVAPSTAPAAAVVTERRHAVLGPIVLLIGAIGLATGWLLPFAFGSDSLYERAAGSGGYGVAFWNGYSSVGAGLVDHAYFGVAAVAPLIVLLVVILAVAGFVKAAPGRLQGMGLAIALVWSIGMAVLFVLVELLGGAGSGLADMLRNLSPGGIIVFLASLIVLIGTLTRFARG
jgi:hypothetical protein